MTESSEDVLTELVLLWTQYSDIENIVLKERQLQAILYKFQFLDLVGERDRSQATFSFVALLTEEIFSFFLERVYEIISKSELYNVFPSAGEDSSVREAKDVPVGIDADKLYNYQDKPGSHHFAQLILRTPSDCNKIIALRTFLTHEIGHHILEFFRHIDIKFLVSRSSFCNLCINLFPNCQWGGRQVQLTPSNTVQQFIAQLVLHQKTRESVPGVIPCHHTKKNIDDCIFDRETYMSQVRTTDEIAQILLDLLERCVHAETELILSDQSVSMVCWQFGIKQLTASDDAFTSRENAKIIKTQLLSLVGGCFNHIFLQADNLLWLDFKSTISQLVDALKATTDPQVISGIIYLIFSLLNNTIALTDGKLQDTLSFVDEDVLDKCVNILIDVFSKHSSESESFSVPIVAVLLKVLDNLRHRQAGKTKKVRKKRKIAAMQHCRRINLPCFFQRILFNVIVHLSAPLQTHVILYFQRHGMCCCLCNIDTISQLFDTNIAKSNQKQVFTFLHKKILAVVLVRNSCVICELKFKSSEFRKTIFALYQRKYAAATGGSDHYILLKHLKHISYLTSYDISVGVLANIVLPIFRAYKDSHNDGDNFSAEGIIIECLNIFTAYLSDVRLIKAFYNEENITHLEDIMHRPKLARLVCDLLKIGIENAAFLGDNKQQQTELSKRLITVQLQGCATATKWINGMLKDLQSEEPFFFGEKMEPIDCGNISPLEILQIASWHWHLNYQLLKSSPQFQAEFLEFFDQDQCIRLSCNVLRCFFFCIANESPTSSESDIPSIDPSINYQQSLALTRYTSLSLQSDPSTSSSDIPSYDDVVRFYSITNNTGFLNQLEKPDDDNNIVLFDIRNQKQPVSPTPTPQLSFALCLEDSTTTDESQSLLGWIFSYLFGVRRTSLNIPSDLKKSSLVLSLLCRATDCKKLLMKLFESSIAVCIRQHNGGADAMQKNLQKLKAIILTQATKNTQQLDTHTTAVTLVLQSLLKIAESSGNGNSQEDAKIASSQRHSGTYTVIPSRADETTMTSTESEGDYYSTRASLVCADSEADCSDNDTEEFFITADEGYDADGEIPELTESEEEIEELWSPFAPMSRYRSHVIHNGICRLVIEVLVELSSKCAENPSSVWTNSLSQLAARLFVIREFLGGPLCLLKGFAPLLRNNDNQLRDLQQSILDLVVDLNTPDVLSIFLSILASKNPPIQILMKYMYYMCSSTLKKQPKIELEFPMVNDGRCMSSSDPTIAEQIDRIRTYHLCNNANTPFLRSACFLPITYTKLWSPEGLTVSIWTQIKDSVSQRSSNTAINDEAKISLDENMRTHLLSIGTNQAMISIYVNGSMNLVFETCKPNAELISKSSVTEDSSQSNLQIKKENFNTNPAPVTNLSPFRNALKQTKLVILNSFNHMHLFHGHGSLDGYFEGSSVELKFFRLCRSKWTHLCFSIGQGSDRFNITVTADGLEQHTISLPFRNIRNLTKTSTFQVVSLGDSVLKATENDSRSSLDGVLGTPMRLTVSNVILFNRKVTDKAILQNLTALGPDFVDMTQCQIGGWKPNFGYLNLSKSYNVTTGNFSEAMKVLKEARFFTYTATMPNLTVEFDPGTDGENCYGKTCGIILYGDLMQNILNSIQASTIICGGLSILLYLFARAVELTTDSQTQSMALDLLLTVALSDAQLYTDFLRNDYLSLIGYVIKTDRCTKDLHLLSTIVNNACTGPVILRRSSCLQVNENTVSCIAHPILIVSILHRFSDWHRSGSDKSEVLEMLFKAILALVRDKHPCKEFNMKQLNRMGLVKELLNLCKVYVIEAPNPIYISADAADSFVSILSIFAGSPPSASLMDEIMKLLLLLHKPSECFVTHDRTKFYFLVSSEGPIKDKGLSLQLPKRQLKQIFRERRRTTSTSLMRTTQIRQGSFKDKLGSGDIRKTSQSPMHSYVVSKELKDLEGIVDCSKMNRGSCRIIKKADVAKLRLKIRRNSLHSISYGGVKPRSQGITHKRISSFSKVINDGNKRLRCDKGAPSSQRSTSTGSNDDTELGEKIKLTWESCMRNAHKKPRGIFKTEFYKSIGIIRLQEKLFILLKDFLCLLPDNIVEEVLTHYVKVEILLVLANHQSTSVRAAILKLLSALSKRISSNEMGTYFKKCYPQHLANQIAMNPTDAHMFTTCLEWATGLYGNLESFTTYETISVQNRLAVNALLSIITHASIQIDYPTKAFNILRTIYVTDPEENQFLIDCGLLQCCVKSLYNMFKNSIDSNTRMQDAIVELLTAIGERALTSVGQMNIVWDILNMVSFYQHNNALNVVKGFRAVQGTLQLNWLNIFFKNSGVNYKVLSLPKSHLSQSEIKTRLDLLIDRCSQFFTTFDPTYVPCENEVRLFELLVSYGISTNIRCNNFIGWGLLPCRPTELRQFIINTLWISSQNELLPAIICDGKMIKSLLWLCLCEQKTNPGTQIENLNQLCLRLGIRDADTNWNFEQELERIEQNRHNTSAKHKSLLEKTVHKFESLAVSCIETSMTVTRVVAELQNAERKVLMNHMKEYDENYTFYKWLEVIRRMTHEGAPWFSSDRCETSFELDDTEGPSRVHTRLRRCHLEIDKRFFMEDYRNGVREEEYTRPLEYLISNYDQQLNLSLNSQVLYNFPAKYLPVDGEIDGEIIITDHKLYFLATYRCRYFYVSCDVANITEIWLKRYQHQEKAFEILLDTNKSLFFSLQNQEDWKIMKEVFLDKIVQSPDQNKILLMTQQWREGLLTNWEYIMTLNQIAGRTYNDLMQYPVFPWVLANYTTDVLDLTDKTNFRKLEKPIAVQHEENEQHYINNYMYIKNSVTNMGTMQLKPYHYSSHYSNSGTVLHFLVRVPPFTSYFLRYQDNNFDLPDRTFHALSTTWNLASKDSPTDVKELIPEFFCLPEMFENFERFDFGCRQSGDRVEDVLLPPWCLRDPRLFILIHRQALESELVRQNIHHWIDLIFGCNQTGQNAIDAINVFHPATYAVFLDSEITDPIERKAVETMVKTYGQMPKQLFKSAHPSSKSLNYSLGTREVIPTVKGLRWGVFVGSPQMPKPILGNVHKLPDAECLVSFNNTNMVYGLPARFCVMQGAETDTFNVISWGHDDRTVRIRSLSDMNAKPKALMYNDNFDEITCCGTDAYSNLFWCGHTSGRITVYKCSNVDSTRTAKSRQSYVKGIKLSYNSAFRKITPKNSVKMEDSEQTTDVSKNGIGIDFTWLGPTVLIRHTDEITAICLSVEFKIAVSAGRDGIAVIWDLNDLSYVRTIERPAEIYQSPVSLIAISPTLGDIVTIHTIVKAENESASTPIQADECFEVTEETLDDFVNVSINPNGKSIMRLHSVNARYVGHIVHEDRIVAVCYSYIKEGVGVNVIATAVEGGIIRLWSSWNLSFVSEIITGVPDIRSITYSTHQHLVILTKESYIQVWEAEGLSGNSPKFPQIAFK